MKKVLAFLAAAAVLCALFTGCRRSEKAVMSGRCLVTESGNCLIVNSSGEPIDMSNKSGNGSLFQGLETGCRIEITCGEVRTTYPGQTDVYSLRVLEKGSKKDIPQKVLDTLTDMGWKIVAFKA